MAGLVAGIDPFDAAEEHDQRHTVDWINSGAGLFRLAKPDVPPIHLVSYFVVTDPSAGTLLLVDHINAGLLLPTGGHCEPGELPWQTVQRECPEELGIPAVATGVFGQRPLFVTVTRTRDPHGTGRSHVDVSLWHVVQADPTAITSFDTGEFHGIRWLTPQQIQATPAHLMDPAMHRFTAKFQQRQDFCAAGGI